MKKILPFFFALLAFLVPIEYKYHNVFRHISKSLKPESLILPSWFDQKILFYPSDWLTLFLFLFVLIFKRSALKESFFQKGSFLIWGMILCAAGSIMASPLAYYPIAYFRLWQLCTAGLLFSAAVSLDAEERSKALKWVLSALIIAGTIQACIAIAQYAHQGSFGLRWLGEQAFHRLNPDSPFIQVPGGSRWIFDRWLSPPFTGDHVIRAMGTMSHPNMLGGFLFMTCLMTLTWVVKARKKWPGALSFFLQFIALILTYSRGAIFAMGIGMCVWLFLHWRMKNKESCKQALLLLGSASLIIFSLFHEQLILRGGLVNYNGFAKAADEVRLVYQKIAFDMLQKHPFSGVGYHQFTYRIPDVLPEGADSSQYLSGVHNIYLMWGAETGLISFVFYLAFIFWILWTILQNVDQEAIVPFASVFIGFLFIGFCDFYLILFQAGRLIFFLVAGLLAAHQRKLQWIKDPVS